MRVQTIALGAALAFLAGCGTQTGNRVPAVTSGTVAPWPGTVFVNPGDPPRILAAQFSSSVIRAGEWWSGKVATTSNVAVVELRSPAFSFILHRSAFGQFTFRTRVLAVPSIYRREFEAMLIARGSRPELTDARSADLVFR